MKFKFRSHWWLAFLALNLVPISSSANPGDLRRQADAIRAQHPQGAQTGIVTPTPEIPGFAFLNRAALTDLIPGFVIGDALDEDKNLTIV